MNGGKVPHGSNETKHEAYALISLVALRYARTNRAFQIVHGNTREQRARTLFAFLAWRQREKSHPGVRGNDSSDEVLPRTRNFCGGRKRARHAGQPTVP